MEENVGNMEQRPEFQNQVFSSDIEVEQIDATVNLMEKPFDPTQINIETRTPSLDTLIKRIENNTIQLNTESYFQRNPNLWDGTKQSRLIESIHTSEQYSKITNIEIDKNGELSEYPKDMMDEWSNQLLKLL